MIMDELPIQSIGNDDSSFASDPVDLISRTLSLRGALSGFECVFVGLGWSGKQLASQLERVVGAS